MTAGQTEWPSGDGGVPLPIETSFTSMPPPSYSYTTTFSALTPPAIHSTSGLSSSTSCPLVEAKGGPTPRQGAIIALSIICGLLLLLDILALLCFYAKRFQKKGPFDILDLEIKGGQGHGHSERHRSGRTCTEYSINGNDNFSDSRRLNPIIQGFAGMRGGCGGHRMACGGTRDLRMPGNLDGGSPVGEVGVMGTNQDFDPSYGPISFNRGTGLAAADIQQAYFSSQPPPNGVSPAALHVRRDEESAGDLSEISSSNSRDPKGSHQSRRRRHSKTAASQSRDQRPKV
jgi:hypothetical protein